MAKVHLLAPDLIAKIAAGEVIERPASVLKELVENSLDASATEVSVRLEDAGKKLIAVKDNGSGIEKDDLETIFLRHSTSKIRTLEDLENIHSLGFRGEALFSIAAISDVLVRSRPPEQDSGWEIHVRGGEKKNVKPLALKQGTEIEAKELFFNTPARRKFLKANVTEVTQCVNTLLPYALLYPERRFYLSHNDKVLLDLPPATHLISRVAHALNLNEQFLLEATKEVPGGQIKIHIVMGDINIKRARKDLQFIFVNGRPVQSRNLSFHVNQTFQMVFPPNMYPAFVLFLTVPAADVDVNIHPTKKEVKIKDEASLAQLLRHLVETTLMTRGQPKQAAAMTSWGEEDEAGSLKLAGDEGIPTDKLLMGPRTTLGTSDYGTQGEGPLGSQRGAFAPADTDDSCTEPLSHFFYEKGPNLREQLKAARYLGQFMKKFLLFEFEKSLLFIDQHAGQERIMYEQLKRQYETGNVEIQPLLTPLLISLSPVEMLAFQESQNALEDSGLSCSQFDTGTIAVHSLPQLLKNPENTIRYFLAEGSIKKFDHHLIARQACRSSVMAGDILKPEQALYQREQLLACADPFICPHGRPTVIQLTEEFLNRQFLRT